MDKLALLISVAALAVGGFAAFGGGDAGDTGAYGGEDSSLDARVGALETEVAALRGVDGALVSTGAAGEFSRRGDAGLDGHPDQPVPARVASLERQLTEMRERMAVVETKTDEGRSSNSMGSRISNFMGDRFFPTADAAAKALELDDAQKSDLERIIDTTKNLLEELYSTPNDDGETLKDVSSVKLEAGSSGAGGRVISLFGNMEKVAKFKQTKLPGTNETYAQAEQRIRAQGKSDARGMMNQAQQEKWDKAHTDHLFSDGPGAGGAVAFSFSDAIVTSESDGK